MVVAARLPKTCLVSESTIRRMIIRLYGKNSDYLADEHSELVVLGFDERKDWTKQPNPAKDVQESHITFTDERDYTGKIHAFQNISLNQNSIFCFKSRSRNSRG